ncbi:RNA polymerase sigma-70 factor [Sphingobacterium phlebotomi]|uniref:RNA polymerase sigma-70 factor n=1 Tax=Sphingobacterium phlebotomi TaxID=2605433 RepID=A0A5D4HG92_9SPHI|nr:RNA polymerase sigma-70 factor [Sphingobacterium phlebotomi]TYR37840.1 RNA polymerase sigma-70 factor [Sphingobacterium phlebotomi]
MKSKDSTAYITTDSRKPDDNTTSQEESLRLLFNDIFLSYERALFKLAVHLTKDSHVARDIVHDVFMKLWEIRFQLQEIKSVESFLFILTRNKVMDYLRKVSSDTKLKKAIWESMQQLVHEEDNNMENKEFLIQLQRAIDQLPPQRKAVYLMRDEGYSYNEIASELHISRHTVKNQVSAAIKTIRKLIRNFHIL